MSMDPLETAAAMVPFLTEHERYDLAARISESMGFAPPVPVFDDGRTEAAEWALFLTSASRAVYFAAIFGVMTDDEKRRAIEWMQRQIDENCKGA